MDGNPFDSPNNGGNDNQNNASNQTNRSSGTTLTDAMEVIDECEGFPENSLVEVSLNEPYTSNREVAGVSVELEVTKSQMAREVAEMCFTDFPVEVQDEQMFEDSVATEYTVKADGDLIIDGGQESRVSWLENRLVEEVGSAKRVKQSLLDSGFDETELDETAQTLEDAVVQVYRNTNITDAELMAKSLTFRGADSDVEGVDDLPHTADVRQWLSDTRDRLEAAQEALDTIESTAHDVIGQDAFENATVPDPIDDTEDQSEEGNTDSEEGVETIEEIRTEMYDSDMSTRSFLNNETTEVDGETIRINAGRLNHTLIVEHEDGSEERLCAVSSAAEAVQRLREEVRDRT